MKRLIPLILTLVLLLCACESKADDWGISMRYDEVSPTGITLVITQDGSSYPGEELRSGSYYALERKTGDTWDAVPYSIDTDSTDWSAEAWPIADDGETVWEENWVWLYGGLTAGDYRIGKEITNGVRTEMYYTEFTIPESRVYEREMIEQADWQIEMDLLYLSDDDGCLHMHGYLHMRCNNADIPCYTGAGIDSLEYLTEDGWVLLEPEVDPTVSDPLLEFEVPHEPFAYLDQEFILKDYGTLPYGTYRIGKLFYVVCAPGDIVEKTEYVEFAIID